MKSKKFNELEKELIGLNSELKKTEKMLEMAVSLTKGNMNKDIEIGDVLQLPVLVPYGDPFEFRVIKKTKTGMIDVENTTNSRVVIRVTFDVNAHSPLYDTVFKMMELYDALEKEKAIMEEGTVNLKKFRK